MTGLLPSSAIASALLAAPRPVTPPPSPPPPAAAEKEDDLAPPPALRVARKVRSLTSLLLHSTRPSPPSKASTSNLRPRTSMGDLLSFKRAESDPSVPTRSRAPPPKSPLKSLFSHHTPSQSSINYSRPITPSTPRFLFASLRHTTPPPSPSKSHNHDPSPRTPLRDVFSLHPHPPPSPDSTHDVCPPSSPTTAGRIRKSSTLSRAAAAARLVGIQLSKPLPVLPAEETSPRSLLFRDEDEDEDEEWVKCVGGEMVRPKERGRGRLEGVQWGSAGGIRTGTGTETGEWDVEKKGVQVDGRW